MQAEINRLSAQLGVQPLKVGARTNDGLGIFADDAGHHFMFCERGTLAFDRVGSLDDVLYWYCESLVSGTARIGDRAQRFAYEYQVLSDLNPEWGKRRVRELAEMFRNGQPEDLALLPDIDT